jgi:hypothetical protein
LLKIHEPMNSIFLREAICEPHLMFIHSPDQIARDSNVECSAYSTGENVYPIPSFDAHLDRPVFTGSSAGACPRAGRGPEPRADDDREVDGWH